jgi:hypothetical protein
VSPILVRPVREQLEHDRIIRLLQIRLKRKGEIVANIGEAQALPVRVGQVQLFPDLVLTTADRSRKLTGTIEVETAESVNHLEAMAQWAHLGKAKVPFHLYVPAGSVEIARRLASENQVNVAEIWSYHTLGDQTRFTLMHRTAPEVKRTSSEAHRAPAAAPRTATPRVAKRAAQARPAAKRPAAARKAAPVPRRKTAARSAASARPAKTARAQRRK